MAPSVNVADFMVDLWDACNFASIYFKSRMTGEELGENWKECKIDSRRCNDIVHGVSVIMQALANPCEYHQFHKQRKKHSQNVGKTEFTLDQYVAHLPPNQTETDAELEARLHNLFPPLRSAHGKGLPLEIAPSVVITAADEVVFWYLPNLLSLQAKAELLSAMNYITKQGPVAWPAFLKTPTESMGVENQHEFSPAWVAPQDTASPRPSTSLEDPETKTSALETLRSIREVLILLACLFSVLHPKLFNDAMEVYCILFHEHRDVLWNWEATCEILRDWPYVFHNISMTADRGGRLWREMAGAPLGMELLVTGGGYMEAILETPSLGKRWMYEPGTVIAMMGRLVPYQVTHVQGERWVMASGWCERLFEICGYEIPVPAMLHDHFRHLASAQRWRSNMGPILVIDRDEENDNN
ncbi:hypothetical protein BKA70DRAFT_1443194 [Coprinopsis sp. MPI-PUGE-AT-0042]|nr:hypothetical protein BKA70DRAFT_1443194 [Coprinopsis sp. MPI-PUGE-AT-0042]